MVASMETILAYKSSLELWSHLAGLSCSPYPYALDRAVTSGGNSGERDRGGKEKGKPRRDGADAAYWLERAPFFTAPLHIAVDKAAKRRRGERCVSHVVRQLGNKGTVWGVGASLATVSPAMCLAQYAAELPLAQLSELACALSGNYCFAAKPDGVVTSAIPLTSLRDMSAFLRAHQQIYGASQTLRAVDLAIDGLGSPYETVLYLLLCLPRKLGGYGFPKPLANSPIAPNARESRVVAQRQFYPDLLWPEKRLVVEYDSSEHHCSPDQVERDARRRNDMESMGYRVAAANRSIITSERLFAHFADNVRRSLGLKSRKETAHCKEARAQLRKLLLAPNSVAELWR